MKRKVNIKEGRIDTRNILIFSLNVVFLVVFISSCNSPAPNNQTNKTPFALISSIVQGKTQGDIILLDGSASSDPDGDNLLYAWMIMKSPANSAAIIHNSTECKASFIPDKDGTYTIGLQVKDPYNHLSKIAQAELRIIPLRVNIISPINGGGIIPRNVTFRWQSNGDNPTYFVYLIIGGNPTLISSSLDVPASSHSSIPEICSNPSFGIKENYLTKTLQFSTTYDWQVAVNNNGCIALSEVIRFSTAPNAVPVALAGDDKTIVQGDIIKLDGSKSYDPDELPITYHWRWDEEEISEVKVCLDDPNSAAPTFIATTPGIYKLKLAVKDGQLIGEDEVNVVVKALDLWGFYPNSNEDVPTSLELVWNCNAPSSATYDVYISTSENFGVFSNPNYGEKRINPGNLDYYTDYFWKIVVHNGQCSMDSPVFKFTTVTAPWKTVSLENDLVRCLTINEQDPNVIYAGTQGRGALVSKNKGKTWRSMIQVETYGIEIHPKLSHILYLATWGNGGVLKSDDWGYSWKESNLNIYVSSVKFLPSLNNNPHSLLATTLSAGIWKSDDGEVWKNVYPNVSSYSNSIAFDGDIIYVASNKGILKSIDQGESWTISNGNLNLSSVWAVANIGPDSIFCSVESYGLFYSGNGGTSWENSTPSVNTAILDILVSPAGNIYCGTLGNGIYLSKNAGGTWKKCDNNVPQSENAAKIWALATDGEYLYAGTSEGLQKSLIR